MAPVIYYIDMNPSEISSGGRYADFSGDITELLGSHLSAVRQEKIRSMRFYEDRLLSLGAGLLLDYGLQRYGLRECDAKISCKANRKPYLTQHLDICFNLSHSGTIALAAFGERELGCDVERIGKADLKVASRFFAAGEQQYLESISSPEEKNTAFYRLWTLKESFIKATGAGVRMPLPGFCIHLDDPDHIWADMDHHVLPYEFYEYSLPGCRAALCMETAANMERAADMERAANIGIAANVGMAEDTKAFHGCRPKLVKITLDDLAL